MLLAVDKMLQNQLIKEKYVSRTTDDPDSEYSFSVTLDQFESFRFSEENLFHLACDYHTYIYGLTMSCTVNKTGIMFELKV